MRGNECCLLSLAISSLLTISFPQTMSGYDSEEEEQRAAEERRLRFEKEERERAEARRVKKQKEKEEKERKEREEREKKEREDRERKEREERDKREREDREKKQREQNVVTPSSATRPKPRPLRKAAAATDKVKEEPVAGSSKVSSNLYIYIFFF